LSTFKFILALKLWIFGAITGLLHVRLGAF
jgi:hypothetical protein